MLAAITWDLDPILLNLGPMQIRYYGLMYAISIYTGFYLWRREALRNGHDPDFAETFLWYGVVGIIFGARLGHCLFYETERYLANPIEILYFWKGGLASHGSTVLIPVMIYLFAKRHGAGFWRVADMLLPGLAFATGFIRIGNLFNSEIVGRPLDHPLAVISIRYDRMMGIDPPISRHPTAFYEVAMGFATYFLLAWMIRKKIRRAGAGLIAGTFLAVYFTFRFIVEFFKEYQVDKIADQALDIAQTGGGLQLTMGQYLSIAPVSIGLFMIFWSLRQPKDAIPEPVSWQEKFAAQQAEQAEKAEEIAAKKRKKKKKKRG